MHAAEPLEPEPICFKVEIATEKLKRYKSSGIYKTPVELIQEGGNILHFEIHKLIIWNK
jgi:hypothetical protein